MDNETNKKLDEIIKLLEEINNKPNYIQPFVVPIPYPVNPQPIWYVQPYRWYHQPYTITVTNGTNYNQIEGVTYASS
jgi:hypothetical protein